MGGAGGFAVSESNDEGMLFLSNFSPSSIFAPAFVGAEATAAGTGGRVASGGTAGGGVSPSDRVAAMASNTGIKSQILRKTAKSLINPRLAYRRGARGNKGGKRGGRVAIF